jgi:FPC/CPF motif-containing protein YcgG
LRRTGEMRCPWGETCPEEGSRDRKEGEEWGHYRIGSREVHPDIQAKCPFMEVNNGCSHSIRVK